MIRHCHNVFVIAENRNSCYANAAANIQLEVNESYATTMPMKANECYGTAPDISLEVNESYGSTMPMDQANETMVTGVQSATIPLSPNQCYGSTSVKDADDAEYAQVQEGMEDEYDYI